MGYPLVNGIVYPKIKCDHICVCRGYFAHDIVHQMFPKKYNFVKHTDSKYACYRKLKCLLMLIIHICYRDFAADASDTGLQCSVFLKNVYTFASSCTLAPASVGPI